MGNFSLTLVDSLDALVIMGDLEEFERAIRLVIDNVKFDYDISVAVFETNIRMVGGLISAHSLAELLKGKRIKGYTERQYYMKWYQGELLDMALDVGYRLLPAFNSSTGLPHPRVNLRYGIKSGKIKQIGETCTACAGTMILEFAALSRLSGEPIFEQKKMFSPKRTHYLIYYKQIKIKQLSDRPCKKTGAFCLELFFFSAASFNPS